MLKELRDIKAIKRSKTEANSAIDDSIGEFEIKNIETEVASIKDNDQETERRRTIPSLNPVSGTESVQFESQALVPYVQVKKPLTDAE